MTQNLQNAITALSCLIVIINLWITYCYPHSTDKHIEKLDDLSKEVEFELRFSDLEFHAVIVWNIAKMHKSTKSYKRLQVPTTEIKQMSAFAVFVSELPHALYPVLGSTNLDRTRSSHCGV